MSQYFSHINSNNEDLSFEEYQKYAKHIIIPEIQEQGQQRLKHSRILSIGAGALAATSLLYLTSSGVGHIGIIDNDHVEQSNLHRQILYRNSDIGYAKGTSAKNHLHKINTSCHFEVFNFKFHIANAHKVVQDYDIILDHTDNFETRWLISQVCQELHKIHVYGAVSTFAGQISVFNYQGGPHYNDLNSNKYNEQNNVCNRNGILGILPGIIGILQATETIKIILGLGQISSGKLITYNLLKNTFKTISLRQQYNNLDDVCHTNYLKLKQTSEIPIKYITLRKFQNLLNRNIPIYLIDIRDHEEYEIEHIVNSVNIPLHKLKNTHNQEKLVKQASQKLIIIYCNSITRSHLASRLLLTNSISHLNLRC
uniref:Molybdopterin biosynthesis protein n=1 Tax=Titanophycus setchellii TaxID=940129 RepID=A0A1G4NYE3_9FLOR|nr:Molybdopterin biosynthesis protein [Titanophycus setchellii]SCW23678.1 Molybdopterin biosynthesis protein [Titanophycus setchellii]